MRNTYQIRNMDKQVKNNEQFFLVVATILKHLKNKHNEISDLASDLKHVTSKQLSSSRELRNVLKKLLSNTSTDYYTTFSKQICLKKLFLVSHVVAF